MATSLTSDFSDTGQAEEFYMHSFAPTPEGYVVVADDDSTMVKIVARRQCADTPEVK